MRLLLVLSIVLFGPGSALGQTWFPPFKAKFLETHTHEQGSALTRTEIIICRNAAGSMYTESKEIDSATGRVIRSLVSVQLVQHPVTYVLEPESKVARTIPFDGRAPDARSFWAQAHRNKESGRPVENFLGRDCYRFPLKAGSPPSEIGYVLQDVETGFYLYKEGAYSTGKVVTQAVEFVASDPDSRFFLPPDLTGYTVNPEH